MGWDNISIGNICKVIAGQSPEGKYYNNNGEGLPFYQGKKDFGAKVIGMPRTWTTHVTKEAQAGDVLMSVRAPVGPINFATNKVCIGRGLAAIRASEKVDREFLFYALLSKQDQISGNEGAVFASINKKQIEAITIPLPPLPEQKRIVAILDEAFAGIDAAIANTEQNLANARELFEIYLNAVFTRKGDGWVGKKLQDILLVQPRNGWSPPSKNHSDTGVPVLTLSSVTGFHFDGNKRKHTNAPTKIGAHYWLRDGELLITRSNTHELVGHVAICSDLSEPTICCDLIMKMQVAESQANTKFIYWQLRTPKLREIITSSAQGANPTMKKINKGIVQSLPICVPSLPAQIEVVEKLDFLSKETQNLEAIYQQKLATLAELKQSILQKAFAGELTALTDKTVAEVNA